MQADYMKRATVGQASNMAHNEYINSILLKLTISLKSYMYKRVPELVEILEDVREDNEDVV